MRTRFQPSLALDLGPRHVPAVALGLRQHPAPRRGEAAKLAPHVASGGGNRFMRRNPHSVAISKSASVSHRQTRTTALGNIPYFHKVPFTLLGCSQLPGPRTIPVRSAPGSARMPGKPRCRGMVGAAANRDGSRSDRELDAAVFTVLLAGRADDLSALVRACPSRMTDNTTIAALHQKKVRLPGHGSLTAGEG